MYETECSPRAASLYRRHLSERKDSTPRYPAALTTRAGSGAKEFFLDFLDSPRVLAAFTRHCFIAVD